MLPEAITPRPVSFTRRACRPALSNGITNKQNLAQSIHITTIATVGVAGIRVGAVTAVTAVRLSRIIVQIIRKAVAVAVVSAFKRGDDAVAVIVWVVDVHDAVAVAVLIELASIGHTVIVGVGVGAAVGHTDGSAGQG